jgi:hypothetical protein
MKSEVLDAYKNEEIQVFNTQLGVIFNGKDNLRPLVIENLIDSSPTATQCAWIYETFLGGAGFEVDLSKMDIGKNILPYTPNHLLFDISEPVSRHQGVFILVGWNANLQKDHFKILSNTWCRLGKPDSAEYSGKILVSKKGWGKLLNKAKIEVFDVYNPNPDVVLSQVKAAGGWKNYKGQILYFKLSNKYVYSKSLIQTAYLFADTENKLGLYYNATTKSGFENTTYIRHGKFATNQDREDFYENVKKTSGIENANKKLCIEDEFDDERNKDGKFRFDTLPNAAKADKYDHFETSSSNFIRKSFKNIPQQLVDYIAGKLGNTSGDDLLKAQSIYNSYISRDQEKLEMLFAELFDNFKFDVNPTKNWVIKQYSLLDDGTVNYGANGAGVTTEKTPEELAAEEIRKAQAQLRGSVGGVQSVLSIQLSVSQGTTTYNAAVAMLENIFGYDNQVAKDMLGEPKATTDGTIN